MFETILEILLDGVLDALKTLPFLFAVYLLIEFMEHKSDNKIEKVLRKMGPFGPVGGALFGCIPQCGFSVAASNLYAGKLISVGTLMAIFISTSDEALPIMLAHPESIGTLWKLLLIKVIVAVIFGIAIDAVIRALGKKANEEEEPFVGMCEHCGCEHGIVRSAIKHSLNIFLYIFIVNIVLNAIIAFVGEDTLSSFLLGVRPLQPVLAAVFGLIPNCAASVVLTELYLNGGLTFGSLVGGLCTGAGLGLVVLFKADAKQVKRNLLILAGLVLIGIAVGYAVDIIGIGI